MTPALQALVDAYYRAQAGSAAAVATELTSLWLQMDAADLDGSWAAIRDSVTQLVASGQVRAAAAPQLFLERLLLGQGIDPAPLAVLSPLAFAGWTADGLELQPVLDSTPVVAKVLVQRGLPVKQAMASTLSRLLMIAASEVQDAGRGSMESSIRLEPSIKGYERVVRTPACARCIVQAGRFFTKNTGFLRHPRCDCVHRPVTVREHDVGASPRGLFDRMTREQQDAAFTADGAKAIRSGADISKVVNARYQGGVRGRSAGMRYPGDSFTTSATTVRSQFGKAQRATGGVEKKPGDRYSSAIARRLSPQGVARMAGDDEQLYLRLLRDNAYL